MANILAKRGALTIATRPVSTAVRTGCDLLRPPGIAHRRDMLIGNASELGTGNEAYNLGVVHDFGVACRTRLPASNQHDHRHSAFHRTTLAVVLSTGVAPEIDIADFDNLFDLVAHFARGRDDDIALVANDRTLTYGALARRARAWAAFLGGVAGLNPGDRVAVMLPNLPEFMVGLIGNLEAGCVQVSVNPFYTARELTHQLNDSGARVLLVLDAASAAVAAVADSRAVERIVHVMPMPEGLAPAIPCLSFEQALDAGHAIGDWTRPALGRGDLALLQYTGGTTGISKGAELTHGNLIANVLQSRAMLRGVVEDGRETIVTALPLYHIFALSCNALTFLSFGARNVLVSNPRDAQQLAAAFAREKATVFTGVNTLFAAVLALPALKQVDLRQVKLAIGGGTAIQRAVSDAWQARTGHYILEGYGLSETSPTLTLMPYTASGFSGSIGVPVPSTEVIVADEDGRSVQIDVEGEICVKGPQVMRGYWRQAEATALAFTAEGFFRTGDIGVMDERGFFRLRDRKKDLVIVSGFNVYPNEVEGVLATLPGVAECAVVGAPDARTGEAVCAFIVKTAPDLDAEAVVEHCRGDLASYKLPSRIYFVDALPKSAVGKILRRELRTPS